MRTYPGRTLASALYAVVVLLAVLPFVDVLLTVWPLNPSQLPWRVGFFGLLTRALPVPLLAATLGLFAAFLFGHIRLLKGLAGLSIGVAVVLFAASILLILDALQMRGVVRQEVQLIYDVTTIRAIATMVVMGAMFLWLGVGGWIAARKPKVQHRASAVGRGLLTTPAVPVEGSNTTQSPSADAEAHAHSSPQ